MLNEETRMNPDSVNFFALICKYQILFHLLLVSVFRDGRNRSKIYKRSRRQEDAD
jgi:hypothetical protein